MVDAVTLGALKRLSFPMFNHAGYNLTAATAGTQAAATPVISAISRFTTVAAGSSGLLPPASGGRRVIVVNAGANALALFPSGTTDVIDALSTQTAFSLPAGMVVEFIAAAAGQWYSSTPSTETLSNLTLTGMLMESVAATVSAAGTNLATATPLAAQINDVTTVAASTGVSLPPAAAGLVATIYSNGANNLKVYPPTSGGTIDGGSAGAAATLSSGNRCQYSCIAAASGGTWLSAKLGATST